MGVEAFFPPNTLSFMQNNVVAIGFKPPANKCNRPGISGLFDMALFKLGTAERQDGKPAMPKWLLDVPGAWKLSEKPGTGGVDEIYEFTGYWCHYEENKTHSCTVANDAAVMFTSRMDRCSFGVAPVNVGSDTPSGARLVAHSNVAATYDVGQQKQKELLEGVLGKSPSLLEPTQYTPPSSEQASTTIGFRIGNDWEFYSQVYIRRRSKYTFIRVEKFA
jgi:hypothetical protein